MVLSLIQMHLIMLMVASPSVTRSTQPATHQLLPVIGAIRWDAWYPGSPYQKNLSPRKWHDRLPFYAHRTRDGRLSVDADSREVMEREIALAGEAGLDYWAFCYYATRRDPRHVRMNQGLKRYLVSPKKEEINFCLILEANHLGPVADWPGTVRRLVALFREPTYQSVAGGRPLVFIFDPPALQRWAGSDQDARSMLADLDQAATAAGLQEPYLVAQWGNAETGRSWAQRLGLDAISAYTMPEKGDDGELPFRSLADANRRFWDDCKALAQQTIPVVNAGWDDRPRRTTPERALKLRGPWYMPPTQEELASHLKGAIEWERENSGCTEANAILIYAWNELDEGGWLVPTRLEGDLRLQAVKRALQARQPATSSAAPDRKPFSAAP